MCTIDRWWRGVLQIRLIRIIGLSPVRLLVAHLRVEQARIPRPGLSPRGQWWRRLIRWWEVIIIGAEGNHHGVVPDHHLLEPRLARIELSNRRLPKVPNLVPARECQENHVNAGKQSLWGTARLPFRGLGLIEPAVQVDRRHGLLHAHFLQPLRLRHSELQQLDARAGGGCGDAR